MRSACSRIPSTLRTMENALPISFETEFVPTSPKLTTRYDNEKKVTKSFLSIPSRFDNSGVFSKPAPMPPSWKSFVNPEGSIYFVHDSASTRIITDTPISEEQFPRFSNLIQYFEAHLLQQEIKLADTTEVYIQFDDSGYGCRYHYYIVDHITQQICWLEPVASGDVGFHSAASLSHLELQVKAEYFDHVQFFPSHEAEGRNMALPQLLGIFLQARTGASNICIDECPESEFAAIDHLTSPTATFGLSVEDNERACDILRTFQGLDHNSVEATWTAARLWHMVFNERFLNHYGEEVTRLDAGHSITDLPTREISSPFICISRVLCQVPEDYVHKLEIVWSDETVTQTRWRGLALEIHEEWKRAGAVGLAFLLSNCLIALAGQNLAALSVGIVLAQATLIASVALAVMYRQMPAYTTTDAIAFLSKACDEQRGFEKIAVFFSLPKALMCWTMVASAAQSLPVLLSFQRLDIWYGAFVLCICVMALVNLLLKMEPTILSWFGTRRDGRPQLDV
ncbi:hypothetical protein NM688_g6248 [Phlebia brevispora]|uniref:Uncharacterized protein n=1 Tax=Phlebia brevispora TaxID=194682 RepID=A0ACC1SID3_9APHY|nr:hypothetical protein NM688_g6248 [Phlebia brevispora]